MKAVEEKILNMLSTWQVAAHGDEFKGLSELASTQLTK
jgi:hypothetical protein